MGVIGALILIETAWGFNSFNTLYANGDLGGGVSVLVIGGLIFVSLTLGVLRLERTALPGALDHLRHCALLYALRIPLCSVDSRLRDDNELDRWRGPLVRRRCRAFSDVELGYRT
jgi:hypothetical protein